MGQMVDQNSSSEDDIRAGAGKLNTSTRKCREPTIFWLAGGCRNSKLIY